MNPAGDEPFALVQENQVLRLCLEGLPDLFICRSGRVPWLLPSLFVSRIKRKDKQEVK